MISTLLLTLSITLRCILPTQQVTTITSDTLGYIWYGGSSGLQRFDGYTSDKFLDDVPYYGYINHIYATNTDSTTLLICTTNGLYLYNYSNNSFRIANTCLKNINTTSVLKTASGIYVVTTLKGVFVFSRDFNLISDVHPHSDYVNSAFQDRHGHIFLATDMGLCLLGNPNNGYLCQKLTSGRVRFIYVDKYDNIWLNLNGSIMTAPLHIFLQQKELSLKTITTNVDIITAVNIDDYLWVATRGQGIYKYHLQPHAEKKYEHIQISNEDMEIKNSVLSLFADKEHNIWVGTIDGLYLIEKQNDNFRIYKHNKEYNNGLSTNIVTSICIDDTDDSMWIGTAEGINRLSTIQPDRIKRYYDNTNSTDFAPNNHIQMIQACNKDSFLISTKNHLRYFSKKKEKFIHDSRLDSLCSKYGMRYVRDYYKDKEQNIWLAFNEGGLAVWKHDDEQLHPLQWNNYKKDIHRTIFHDDFGYIWISADTEGLYRLRLDSTCNSVEESYLYPRELFNNQCITAFCYSSRNVIYIGTFSGLFTLNTADSSISQCQLPASHAQYYISSILEDNQYNIWVSSLQGVFKIVPNKSSSYFEIAHNTDITKLWYIIGHNKTTDGRLWWGGTEGLICCNPEIVCDDTIYRRPLISRVFVNNKHIQFLGRDINYLCEPFILQHDQNFLTFYFSTLDYPNCHNVSYSYQLEGVNKQFVITDATRPFAAYSDLKPGKYVLHIKATNSTGQWLNNETIIRFQILRPWYRKWWAYVIYMCLLSIVIYIFVFMYKLIRKLRRGNHRLQQTVTNMAGTPKDVNILTNNEAFINAALEIVEKNIENERFTVEQLASELCVSTSGLYRRLQQLTQLSPVEYIRFVRMKRAAQLLKTQRYKVYEVCEMVGFSDQRYFSSCFKKQFGVTPKYYSLHHSEEAEKSQQNE
ncbi:MAG: helix-turn-helix domain-containing protein [Paludibacteraceae bacterium]|nr:helix-turn-helix domain-containing protein [Paludibacteraceae bacterium]